MKDADMSSTQNQQSFASLLPKLTLEEKVALLSGNTFNTTPGIPRLGIPQIKVSDSINGIRPSQLDSGMTTACFPSTTCLASTWDAELLGCMGEQVAHQARLKSAQVVLGPTINMHRDPRGGRNFECFSEDPLLSGQLAGAIVNGIQKHGVGACPKHFVCNDSETLRHFYDVTESPHGRTLREIYLAAWQHLLRVSDPVGIMTAYNKVDGSFCAENRTLITDILRGSWGYRGITMSDWFATHSTVAAVKAGLDLEMPFPIFRGDKLIKEVELGTVTEDDINQRALKMLELRDRTAACHADEPERSEISEKTNQIARELASGGFVLLKNEDGTLPLSTTQSRRPIKVAVIGEFAAEPPLTGGGSASCRPQYRQSPVELLRQALGEEHGGSSAVVVEYAPGVRTRRIIPAAPTAQLTAADGRRGVDVAYFNDDGSDEPVLAEFQESAEVFMLGQSKPGLRVVPGSRLEMSTMLTPATTGAHTLAVRCTGAFSLAVDGAEVLARADPPDITTEQFIFNPRLRETRAPQPLAMTAGRPYRIRLTMHSRDPGMNSSGAGSGPGEPTPYGAALCFEEARSPEQAIAEAAALARDADVSIVFCGRGGQHESEGFDLVGEDGDAALDAEQAALAEAVAAAAAQSGGRTVLVLHCGNPIELSDDLVGAADAVLLAHFPGQEGPAALVDVLTGRVSPSGRLATTWFRTVRDAPSYGHFPASARRKAGGDGAGDGDRGGPVEIAYAEGVRVGYRCLGPDAEEDPAAGRRVRWPFGFGLSYTSFAYDGLRVAVDEGPREGAAVLRCAVGVANVGGREGREVVQLYVRPSGEEPVWRPERELKAFTKILLQPRERRVVDLEVDLKVACSYWDEGLRAWKMVAGRYGVEVGGCRGEFTVAKTVVWDHL